MPDGVFNARSLRNSDGVNSNLLAPATNGTWLKKHEAPIVLPHHVGYLCLAKGRRRRVKDSEQSDIQAPNPSPLSSPLRTGRGERRGRRSPTTPDHGGRPRRRITDCFDNLFDCIDHQLRFLGLNVVRALGRDFVFGVWCNCRQRVLRGVPRLIECSRKIGWQWLPWAEIERLALRQNKERHGTERFRSGS